MDQNIYNYFQEYGFNKIDIDAIKNMNNNYYFFDYNNVVKLIDYLEYFGFDKSEIISIINSNPFILDTSVDKLKEIKDIFFNHFKMSNNEMICLLNKNPNIYTINPNELENKLNTKIFKNLKGDEVIKLLLNSPKLLELDTDSLNNM